MENYQVQALAGEVAADALAALLTSLNEVLTREEISPAFAKQIRAQVMTILITLEGALR